MYFKFMYFFLNNVFLFILGFYVILYKELLKKSISLEKKIIRMIFNMVILILICVEEVLRD